MTLLFTGWVVCAPDLCALQRCVDWSGQRSHSVRPGRTDLSEWDGQNGFGVRYIPYERRAQRSRAQTATRPVNSNYACLSGNSSPSSVGRKPNVFFSSSTSRRAFCFTEPGITALTARIRMFLGVWDRSTNSRSCVR